MEMAPYKSRQTGSGTLCSDLNLAQMFLIALYQQNSPRSHGAFYDGVFIAVMKNSFFAKDVRLKKPLTHKVIMVHKTIADTQANC